MFERYFIPVLRYVTEIHFFFQKHMIYVCRKPLLSQKFSDKKCMFSKKLCTHLRLFYHVLSKCFRFFMLLMFFNHSVNSRTYILYVPCEEGCNSGKSPFLLTVVMLNDGASFASIKPPRLFFTFLEPIKAQVELMKLNHFSVFGFKFLIQRPFIQVPACLCFQQNIV